MAVCLDLAGPSEAPAGPRTRRGLRSKGQWVTFRTSSRRQAARRRLNIVGAGIRPA